MTRISMKSAAENTQKNSGGDVRFLGLNFIIPERGGSGVLIYTTLMVLVSIYKQRVFMGYAETIRSIRLSITLIGVIWETSPLSPLHSPIAGRAVSGASA